jgi:glycosyltransferase 2 family protein
MSDESTRSSFGRRFLLMAGKITVSVALLALLFSRIDAARLWTTARHASMPWLIAALAVYGMNMLASTWRWRLLLHAQDVRLPGRTLLGSFLVANFFNNFLPSNIGGDVIRIRDTAGAAHSKTLATTIVLVDRGLGLMGLVLISALGATVAADLHGSGASPIWPSWLWALFLVAAAIAAPVMYAPEGFGRLLQPLTVVHPEWVGTRIDKLTAALSRFREHPGALAGCFSGALFVQGLMVVFYLAVVYALKIPITPSDLAVIVPLSLVVQMLPVSVNGLGLREATFSFYFARLGLPIESAVLLSLMGAALMMFFSLSGAAVYVSRGHH